MKKINLKIVGTIACSLLTISSFSQNNWQKGGNNSLPVGSLPILGTDATWNSPLLFQTNRLNRTTLLGTVTTPYNQSGFMGFNDPTPLFHVDINTQNPGGTLFGELLLRARIADDPNAYISFVNIATAGTTFVPTLLARQSNNLSAVL